MNALAFLALPIGYLLGWFLYGLAPLPVLIVVLLNAALLAFLAGRKIGILGFLHLLLVFLAGATIMAVLVGTLILFVILGSPDNPLPINRRELGVVLAFGLLILSGAMLLMRWLARWNPASDPDNALQSSPAAPWLLIAGVLLFAFYPAVRVDCRGFKQADSFLSYGSGFQGNVGQNYWSRKPELIIDRPQLPQGFKPDVVQVAATRCEYTAANHPRPLSFNKSSPLVIVYLIRLNKSSNRPHDTFAALFAPINHQKQTPWLKVQPPYPYGSIETRPDQHYPYHNPAWAVYPYMPTIPPELTAQLKH